MTSRRSRYRNARHRSIESLERRLLMAQTIDTPSSPITQITIEDTGEFQFNTDQVFEQNAGDGQVYQFSGGKPLSGVYLRLEDGTLYGNSTAIGFAIDFVPVGEQTRRTETDGTEVISSTFAPSDGAFFQITQEVRYTPGEVFFFVDNTVVNTGNAPLAYSFFVYADANPSGRGVYDSELGAIASVDAAGQPTIVFDPLDATSVTAADFHEAGSFFDVVAKISTAGTDLAFSPANPQPPGTFDLDTGMALQWAAETLVPSSANLYAFTIGNDPLGGGDPDPPPTGDSDRPTARLSFIDAPDPNTRVVSVAYDDGFDAATRSGVNSATFDDNDIFLSGPGIDDTNRFPTSISVVTDDLENNFHFVTYTFTLPGGGFANGVFDINLFPGGVSDFAGNAAIAAAQSGPDPNKIGFFEVGPQRLTVTRETNPDVLRQRLLGDSTGLTITDFTVRGQQDGTSGDVSTGTYVNPGGLYGLAPGGGIVISTGDAGDYSSGPNQNSAGNDYATSADGEQEDLLDQLSPPGTDITYRDVTQIDIEFNLDASVDNIFFDVVWGTEESIGSTSFPDGFGLFLNGVNIARTLTLNTNDGNATEPINVANSNLSRIEGTELDALVAVGGNPVISFSNLAGPDGPVPLQATGNTLTFIIADAQDSFVASTAYISALGVRQTATVDTSNIATNIDVLAVTQQNGKVVIAGATQSDTPGPVCQRFANGVLDAAFGNGGTAEGFGLGGGSIQSIILQPDGKILVAGQAGGDIFVGRYTADGDIDSSFGGNGDGSVTLDVGSLNDIAFALALDAQGRIIVAGSTDTLAGGKAGSDFVVARFTSAGVIDTSFSGGDATPGFSVDEFDPGDINRAGSIAVTSNNGLVVAGQTGSLVAVAKYNENGSLDTGFDVDGKRIVNELKTSDPVVGLGIQGDGKIVLAGADSAGAGGQLIGSNFLLVRLTPQGALDTSFGTNGIVRTDMGGTEDADAIRLGTAGIYVFGTRATDKAGDPNNVIVNTAVALYNDNGGNTTMLGPNGYVFFDPVVFQVADDDPALQPGAIGNPFQQLMQGTGAIDAQGNVVASKPNVSGAGSNVVQVVQAPNNPDTPAPPTAALPAGLQLAAAQADFSFTVEYSDTNGVNVGSIGADDVTVSRGGTALVVKSANVNNNTSGTPRSVTYTVAPADGSFDRFDNGTYVVRLNGNQVADVNGLAATEGDLGTFAVNIPTPTGTPFGGRTRATLVDPGSGTPVTISSTNGTAQAFVENGRISIQLDGASNAGFTIKARGPVTLGNVVVNGSLKSFSAKTANLSGVMAVTGSLGKVTLSDLSGTILSGGTIAGVTLNSVTGGKVLAGASFGNDLAPGGGDDNFAAGSITKITVKGAVSGPSVFAAGVNPGAGNAFADGNDTGSGSIIKSLSVKGGTSAETRFLAATFPRSAKLGAKVVPLQDARFVVV